MMYRDLVELSKRQYAAAKTPKASDGFRPVDFNVNDLISSSSPIVRARTRQLVRDFPYLSRAVNVSRICLSKAGSRCSQGQEKIR